MTMPALSRRVLMLLAVLLPLVLLFAWVALRSGPLAAVDVTTTEVVNRAVRPALFGIGTVEARYTHRVGPTAPGRVTGVLVDVGDRVAAGQHLASIDPVDLDARIKAAVDSTERAGALEQAAVAQIADARARLAFARDDARRSEQLFAEGWMTRAAVDQKRQALAAAEAALAAAEASRRAAGNERDRTGSERMALEEQKANLRLVAPVAGLVVRRLAEPGTTVVAGQAVIDIVDPAELWIAARFDQTRAGGLAAGLPARIILRSRADAPLTGKVTRVEPLADAQTEEILAKIGFDEVVGAVPVGELAEVTVSLPPRQPQPAIPNAAILRVDGEIGVWAIRDGDPEFAPVTLGVEDRDGWVQILSGLAEGDRIILHSARPVSSRSRINIVERLP
ncbi:efflux RND transporter periplasmic adaptor subunit [Sandaracinobacteroides sp. A072]|uniref:efflux RND transporter periplasmic adaptor subunit n=1 Tax=Sandaracinobacteroides sp. A072 TaxID=3461146 RepID=UPI0040410733